MLSISMFFKCEYNYLFSFSAESQYQKTLAEHASTNQQERPPTIQPSQVLPTTSSVSYPNGHGMPQPFSQTTQNGVYGQSSSAYSYNQTYQAYPQQYGNSPAQAPVSDPLAALPEEQKV
jgi:hypothetical protein